MRINSIRLQNFRQHADTFIEFDSGLTGIIGANGTGKSTILEAIAWALYGNPAARGKRDSIRWLRAPARASVKVELDFELGGHRYRVVRGLTSAELYLDRATAPIANSNSGVSEVLRRRLGMSLDEFFNTYFTGQKELSVMAAMGPTDRAQFLSRLLGYERLRVAQDLARERRRAITAEATGVKTGMPDADVVRQAAKDAAGQLATAAANAKVTYARRAAATAVVVALTPRWEAVQAERERVQRIESDLRVAESEQTARQRELDRQDRELADLATAQAELSTLRAAIQPLVALRIELETMDRLAREEGRRQTLAMRERELTTELTRLRERRAQLEPAPRLEEEGVLDLKRRRAELDETLAALEAAKTEWVRDKQEADTKIEQIKQTLAEYKKQRELLVNEGENGTCPICARPLGDHYRTVLDSIDEQLGSLAENGRYFRARVEQLATVPPDVGALEEKKTEAAETIAKLEKKMTRIHLGVQELATVDADLADRAVKHATLLAELAQVPAGYAVERHASLRKQCDDLQTLESRATKLGGALEREGQLRMDRDRVAAALGIIRIRLAELEAERDAAKGVEARFEETRAEHGAATATLRATEVEAATAQARHGSAVVAAEVAERALADLDRAIARLEELTRERRLHEELDRAYTDLRTELNVQLRPEVSERASVLLAELTDGRYDELELDESYDIIILEGGVPKSVISGGEEDLTNLVLRLAISQMIAERAGQPLSLLILDEVFGSLDESRRHNVIDLLRHLHDRFEQIIVITHVELPSVVSGGGLDRTIVVKYDEGSGASSVDQEASSRANDDEELEMGAA
jgi:DNA repair protein SbcC/Rad50